MPTSDARIRELADTIVTHAHDTLRTHLEIGRLLAVEFYQDDLKDYQWRSHKPMSLRKLQRHLATNYDIPRSFSSFGRHFVVLRLHTVGLNPTNDLLSATDLPSLPDFQSALVCTQWTFCLIHPSSFILHTCVPTVCTQTEKPTNRTTEKPLQRHRHQRTAQTGFR